MSTLSDRTVEILWQRFCHRTDDWAYQRPDGQYSRAERPLTREQLRQHVAGDLTVGVYQVRGSTVRWTCLDVDSESGDAERVREATQLLARTARHFGLDPVIERSGGKGWHLWLLSEEIEASLARTVAGGLLSEAGDDVFLGVRGIEVFPKQVEVNQSTPFGNLVKLPIGKRADNQVRGTIVDPEALSPLPPAEQVALLERARGHTAAELAALVEENGWEPPQATPPVRSGAGFVSRGAGGELPCFSHILEAGVDEGHRDNVLYSLAKVCRRQGMPQPATLSMLQLFDGQKVRPPLGDRVVQQKVASAYKGGMSIGCESIQAAGLCPALTGAPCPVYGRREETRQQLQGDFETGALSIEPLIVIKSDPPKYRATVNGVEIELSLQELYEFKRFKIACIAKLQFVPVLPYVKSAEGTKLADQTVWERQILAPALASVVEYEEAPPDAGVSGATWDNIRVFLRETRSSEHRDDVFDDRLVLLDECFIFRGRVLRGWLARHQLRSVEEHELWAIARRHGATTGSMRTAKGTVRVWRIPVTATEGD